MSVAVRADGVIALEGDCGVDDAETLQRAFLNAPGTSVEWTRCTGLHAAVLQVLLAAARPVRGVPANAFLRAHVARLVHKTEGGGSGAPA